MAMGVRLVFGCLSLVSEALIAGLVDEIGVPVSGRFPLDSAQKEEAVAFLRYSAEMMISSETSSGVRPSVSIVTWAVFS